MYLVCYKQVSSVLHKMCTWFPVDKLSLNVSKTSYMLFGNNTLSANIDITINGVNIDRDGLSSFLVY